MPGADSRGAVLKADLSRVGSSNFARSVPRDRTPAALLADVVVPQAQGLTACMTA